jgi:hypothetical protein
MFQYRILNNWKIVDNTRDSEAKMLREKQSTASQSPEVFGNYVVQFLKGKLKKPPLRFELNS